MVCYLLTNQKNDNPLFGAFIEAAGQAGHKINIDMNGEDQEGFGMFDTTMHQGERAGVAKYYLNPVKNRKKLRCIKILCRKNII